MGLTSTDVLYGPTRTGPTPNRRSSLGLLVRPTCTLGISLSDVYTTLVTPCLLFVSFLYLFILQHADAGISCASRNEFAKKDLVARQHMVLEYCRKEASGTVGDGRSLHTLGDYQWIPLALLCSALSFLVPLVVWIGLRNLTVFPFYSCLRSCKMMRGVGREEAEKVLYPVMDHLLHMRTTIIYKHKNAVLSAPITALYAIFKCLVLACIVPVYIFIFGSMMIKEDFSATESFLEISADLIDPVMPHAWGLGIFVRMMACHFPYQVDGSDYVVYLCMVRFNNVSEKCFLLLFLWLTIMLVAQSVSLFYWLFFVLSPSRRAQQIVDWLKLAEPEIGIFSQQRRVDRFVRLLGADTWLLLTLLSPTAGSVVAAHVTGILWKRFLTLEGRNQAPTRLSGDAGLFTGVADPVRELPIVAGILADAD